MLSYWKPIHGINPFIVLAMAVAAGAVLLGMARLTRNWFLTILVAHVVLQPLWLMFASLAVGCMVFNDCP